VWYTRRTIEHGWSRNVLVHQIERDLYRRRANTAATEGPHTFDFLSLGQEALERDIERGLTEHIRAFLLELGVGFAFVGRQYRLEVASQDYYSVSPNTRSPRRSPIILRGACRLSWS
jgi:predicted nuclease of restriction endonuclease-like (RecB) superfamily